MSKIPIVFLKTRSSPTDNYEDYFTSPSSPFTPSFVPVLEHLPNDESLSTIAFLLQRGGLNGKYGGMIFTSQRAVEGFSRIVKDVEVELKDNATAKLPLKANLSPTPFPLYTVGPATSRALNSLLSTSSLLQLLHAEVLGADTGNGANLATYILQHYNNLHAHVIYDLYEAPRLPFIPLVGDRSEQYGVRGRLERDDAQLKKKPLLFLVGETRRDIIPKTLMNPALGSQRIEVEEAEVYRTVVMQTFEEEFAAHVCNFEDEQIAVVVIFSPISCHAVLRILGLLDEKGQAKRRRPTKPAVLVATIGPTTRDHFIESFGVEPDVCAQKPSPEGVGNAIEAWLEANKQSL